MSGQYRRCRCRRRGCLADEKAGALCRCQDRYLAALSGSLAEAGRFWSGGLGKELGRSWRLSRRIARGLAGAGPGMSGLMGRDSGVAGPSRLMRKELGRGWAASSGRGRSSVVAGGESRRMKDKIDRAGGRRADRARAWAPPLLPGAATVRCGEGSGGGTRRGGSGPSRGTSWSRFAGGRPTRRIRPRSCL